MTELTRAIVSHDLHGIEAALESNPDAANQTENGWLPVEWAKRTGNFVTLVRLYRALGDRAPHFDTIDLLNQYLALLGSDEYEPSDIGSTASMLWGTLFHAESHVVGRWRRPLVANEGQRNDLAFLLARAGLNTKEELLLAVRA